MTAVLAQYLSSNQDQEMNVNEKQSAQLVKESRFNNLLATFSISLIAQVFRFSKKLKFCCNMQHTYFCLLTSAIRINDWKVSSNTKGFTSIFLNSSAFSVLSFIIKSLLRFSVAFVLRHIGFLYTGCKFQTILFNCIKFIP